MDPNRNTEQTPRAEQELVELLDKSGERNLVEQVSLRKLHVLLRDGSPTTVAKQLRSLRDSAEELHRLELAVDLAELREILYSNGMSVRGRDKQRRPVMWMRTVRNQSRMAVNENVVQLFWLMHWAYQLREEEHLGMRAVLDDRERSPLDFNLNYFRALTKIYGMAKAGFETDAVFVICNGATTELVFQIFANTVPSLFSEGAFGFSAEPRAVLDCLEDPTNVPSFIFPEQGIPFQPDFASVGNYNLMFQRKAYTTMKVSDWTIPSEKKREQLHESSVMIDVDLSANEDKSHLPRCRTKRFTNWRNQVVTGMNFPRQSSREERRGQLRILESVSEESEMAGIDSDLQASGLEAS